MAVKISPEPPAHKAASIRRVGVDPVDRVFLFENHDRAYQIWREAQAKDQLLLHIDAHHDMWWAKKDSEITIANFISPAMRDGLVREVIWVVPDASWGSRSAREQIVRHLRRMRRQHPGPRQRIHISRHSISVVLNGKRLTVHPLSLLPEIPDPVLLDIDTDFLVIPRVSHKKADEHSEVPWCWPDELVGALRLRKVRTSLVTIAYSVEGGYTPLKWKHLGDELNLRLTQPEGASGELAFYSTLRNAAILAARNDGSAEAQFRRALELNPNSAAAHASLALYLFDRGRVQEAQGEYQTALGLDASYRSGYAQLGFVQFHEKRYDLAEREFTRMLELNPADAYSFLGLALLAKRKKSWTRAHELLKSCIAHDAKIIEAHRLLGDVLSRLRLYPEAAAAYENSLKLGLMGVKRFTVLLTPEGRYSLDEGHWSTHAKLARIWEKLGRQDKALSGYRMAIASKHAKPRNYFRMAMLQAKRLELVSAVSLCAQAVKVAKERMLRHG